MTCAETLRTWELYAGAHFIPHFRTTENLCSMSEVRACARALVQRVAEGGEIPIASLRELGDLVLRSELVAVSHQLLEGPPEFALRRAMELSGLILAAVVRKDREEERETTK